MQADSKDNATRCLDRETAKATADDPHWRDWIEFGKRLREAIGEARRIGLVAIA